MARGGERREEKGEEASGSFERRLQNAAAQCDRKEKEDEERGAESPSSPLLLGGEKEKEKGERRGERKRG